MSYTSQLTGQQIDEALLTARNIHSNSGIPISSGNGIFSFRHLDDKLDETSTGVPSSPAVMRALNSVQLNFLVFKGTVATVSDLPANPRKGDAYKVLANGHFYVWNDSEWGDIGTGIFGALDTINNIAPGPDGNLILTADDVGAVPSYVPVVDTQTAYLVDVPEDSMPTAVIERIGGGSAVQGQMLIGADVKSVVSHGCNLFDESAVTPDAYIKASDGTIVTGYKAEPVWASDFMPVFPGKYKSNSGTKTGNILAIYDAGKQYVRGVSTTTDWVTEIQPGEAYVRYSIWGDKNNIDNFMFVRGDVLPSKYVSYQDDISYPIDTRIRAFPDYGLSAVNAFNEVDYARRKYIQRVTKFTLGGSAVDRVAQASTGVQYARFKIPSGILIPDGTLNVIDNYGDTPVEKAPNSSGHVYIKNGYIFRYDNEYVDLDTAVRMVNDRPLVIACELAEPIEIHISNLIQNNFEITVFPGGTIEFQQADGILPVENTVQFREKTAKPTYTASEVGAVAVEDILTLEEIEASTDLTGKVPAAQALKDNKWREIGTVSGYNTIDVPSGAKELCVTIHVSGYMFSQEILVQSGTWTFGYYDASPAAQGANHLLGTFKIENNKVGITRSTFNNVDYSSSSTLTLHVKM